MKSRFFLQRASLCSRLEGLSSWQNAKHLNKLLQPIIYQQADKKSTSFHCRKYNLKFNSRNSSPLPFMFVESLCAPTQGSLYKKSDTYSTKSTEHNVNYTTVLMEDIAIRLNDKDYNFGNILFWISKLESTIYNEFAFPISCDNPHTRKNQIFYHVSHKQLEEKFSNDIHFQQIIKSIQLNLAKIEVNHFPVILRALMPLLGSRHELIQKLCDICTENIDLFTLSGLIVYLQSASHSHCPEKADYNDTNTRKIREIIRKKLWDECVPFSDVSSFKTFCETFQYLGLILDSRLFHDGLDLVTNTNNSLWIDDPVETLNAFSKFPFNACGRMDEESKGKIYELALKLNSVDIDLLQLDVESCLSIATGLDTSLVDCPFLESKRWAMLKSFVDSSNYDHPYKIDLNQYLKVCLLFFSTNTSPSVLNKVCNMADNNVEQDLLRQFFRLVDCCDLYWLLNILKVSALGKMPLSLRYRIEGKLEDVLHSYSGEHIDWLLDKTSEEFCFHFMLSCDSKAMQALMDVIKRRLQQSTDGQLNTKTSAFVLVHQILNQVSNNQNVELYDLDVCVKVLNKIDFQGLSYLITKMKIMIMKNSFPPMLKTRIRKLSDSMGEEICRRLLEPSTVFDQISTSSFPSFLLDHNRLHPDFVSAMPQITSSLNTKECLLAINVLSNSIPYYLPDTYENLLQAVYRTNSIPPHSFLSLLKLISTAGYQPEDVDLFTDFCIHMQRNILECKTFNVVQELEMMYYLSLMEIYDDVHNFFTIANLMKLDEEINNLNLFKPSSASVAKNLLSQLVRNVIVECPYLPLQPFVPVVARWDGSPERQKLCNSVRRIYGDSPSVVENACSPYGHLIDALVHFEWDGFAYTLKDVKDTSSDPIKQSYRISVLYLSHKNFCKEAHTTGNGSHVTGSDNHLTGSTKATIRQLQLLGYTVIDVPYRRLQMMDLQSESTLDEFMKTRIETETGACGLFD